MKDVFKGKIISEFVGLNSKMYSLIDVDNEESKKANGVNKMLLKKQDIKNILMFCLIKNDKRQNEKNSK